MTSEFSNLLPYGSKIYKNCRTCVINCCAKTVGQEIREILAVTDITWKSEMVGMQQIQTAEL